MALRIPLWVDGKCYGFLACMDAVLMRTLREHEKNVISEALWYEQHGVSHQNEHEKIWFL